MSLGSPKAYQVLAILDNPTFKLPPKGLQKITDGSLWIESEKLPSVSPGDYKGFLS